MDKEYAQYLLRKTREDYDLIAEEFSSKRQESWPELKFLFDDYLMSGDKLLDLGCGNGRFFEFCKDKNIDYLGIDFSPKLIGIAREKHPQEKFQVADALNLPFPDNYFDKVYGIAVFHHIPSKELRLRFLLEAKRVVRSGGKLILTVWKFRRFETRLLLLKFTFLKLFGLSRLDFGDFLESWGKTKIKRYYHWFSKKESIDLIKKAGLTLKKIDLAKNEKGNRQNTYLIAEK